MWRRYLIAASAILAFGIAMVTAGAGYTGPWHQAALAASIFLAVIEVGTAANVRYRKVKRGTVHGRRAPALEKVK